LILSNLLPNQLLGGDELENARRIVAILSGQEIGAARDMIVLNAAAALHLAGFGGSLEEAITIANESIDSGKALTALDLLRVHSKAGAA